MPTKKPLLQGCRIIIKNDNANPGFPEHTTYFMVGKRCLSNRRNAQEVVYEMNAVLILWGYPGVSASIEECGEFSWAETLPALKFESRPKLRQKVEDWVTQNVPMPDIQPPVEGIWFHFARDVLSHSMHA